ncbi:MAG: mannose-1-phosphate guanylyltransferase [Alloprevotella sp.]|nr:mannose-1-phosphate guanylyltransferase [Alloprevotella sp.]
MNHLVIMAGGVGSRFWPLSSTQEPKQFLDVLGVGKTLLQLTIERFEGIVPKENVWIVTSEQYADIVYEMLPEIPKSNVLLEPCRRNTAPCICYVSWRIKMVDPKANIIVSPSDHTIADVAGFREVVQETLEFASETDSIVTIGIKPTRPETGYGYIKADLSYASSRKRNIFRVDAFKEKPSLEVAEEYVAQDGYFWNSGIFIWSVSTIVNAFRVYAPDMSAAFEKLQDVYDTEDEQTAINAVYAELEPISVDYAILEKAGEIFVCPASFGWSDLGTWSSLRNELDKDDHGNAAVGRQVKFFDSHHCVVHTKSFSEVVVEGLDGYVVAENDGKLLICRLSEEQRIKLFHDN